MTEAPCVYREAALLKQTTGVSEGDGRVALDSYDE